MVTEVILYDGAREQLMDLASIVESTCNSNMWCEWNNRSSLFVNLKHKVTFEIGICFQNGKLSQQFRQSNKRLITNVRS
ncbi:Reticulocyte-binding protein [Dirofilaria immitis]